MEDHSVPVLFFTAFIILLSNCAALDTIYANQPIKDGETIISEGEMFELGFFSPGKSMNRYLGIWYKKISNRTVVWVANRDSPVNDTSGMFKVSSNGNLQILSGSNTLVWSFNSTVPRRSYNLVVVVQLLDTGNLVVWDSGSQNLIWQSFDYPGDTLLAGMKIGKDLVTGLEWFMTSWKSPDDPSIGQVIISRFGPWNGNGYSGHPIDNKNPIYFSQFVNNDKEISYKKELRSSVNQIRIVLTYDGKTQIFHWNERIQDWIMYGDLKVDSCDRYELCGPYGICSISKHPPCTCMQGFEPKNPEQWDASDWSSGCQSQKPLNCGSGDGFKKISGVKLPDTRLSWYNYSMTLGECEMFCRKNCSCTCYANLDIRNGGSGCLIWFGELMDIREYDDNHDIYGVLDDGQEVAVKRLSETSLQGLEEFKNEVICIAKLQHRNLVKLLGHCIHRNEMILIYEYMSNKSLDSFVFDETRSLMLDWPKRFHIILGIARGILYLHQDSRLQIIHRDIKAGNILLDGDMNPKISDFGLARKFVGHDTMANTKKVWLHFSEYAIYGHFSTKSDVYSFGVLVLEIAWRLYKEGRSIELMSGSLQASFVVSEVLRSIHVALLCVQHQVEDRPTMLSVVLMLVSEGAALPEPKQPAFFNEESCHELESLISVDNGTITLLYAR
ncbi:putative protein kinase RLK-Pelle-DLSV family [Helianthus annuus]|nr:putative protein kinase RLK-Pelle-DLSV family [Helianthus annuus]